MPIPHRPKTKEEIKAEMDAPASLDLRKLNHAVQLLGREDIWDNYKASLAKEYNDSAIENRMDFILGGSRLAQSILRTIIGELQVEPFSSMAYAHGLQMVMLALACATKSPGTGMAMHRGLQGAAELAQGIALAIGVMNAVQDPRAEEAFKAIVDFEQRIKDMTA